MNKQSLSLLLVVTLVLSLLILPGRAEAASVKSGTYSATVGETDWEIAVKKLSGNKVKVQITTMNMSRMLMTKAFTRKVKNGKISFNLKDSSKYIGRKGTIKFNGKKLKCKIDGISFTAKRYTSSVYFS